MAGVTAMAAGGEQTQSAHACDVSLGARITHQVWDQSNAVCLKMQKLQKCDGGNRVELTWPSIYQYMSLYQGSTLRRARGM